MISICAASAFSSAWISTFRSKDGVVTDDTRIRETLPTLRLAIENGARLVLASHLGRPKGSPIPSTVLRPRPELAELLGKPVEFAPTALARKRRRKAKR